MYFPSDEMSNYCSIPVIISNVAFLDRLQTPGNRGGTLLSAQTAPQAPEPEPFESDLKAEGQHDITVWSLLLRVFKELIQKCTNISSV